MSSVVSSSYAEVIARDSPRRRRRWGFVGVRVSSPCRRRLLRCCSLCCIKMAGWWLQLSLVALVVDGLLVAGGFGCRWWLWLSLVALVVDALGGWL